MRIVAVAVEYGELRSENFNNKSISIRLAAKLDAGEVPRDIKERLFALAKSAVEDKFGDAPDKKNRNG